MSQGQRTRVAIVGAGIVGLAFAVALNKFDKEHKFIIDIYEAGAEISAGHGAGISIWPLTLKILREMGAYQTLAPYFDHYPDLVPRIIFALRKGDQKDGFHVYDAMNNGGALRIHRTDLQRGFIQHLPLPGTEVHIKAPCALYLRHRLVDYEHDGPGNSEPITLHFDDMPSTKCDILIGADGVKSTVRQLFLSQLPNSESYDKYRDLVWSGFVAYRGLVPREELERLYPGHRAVTHPGLIYTGVTRYVVTYPVSEGKFVNVVAVTHTAKHTSSWQGPWRVDVTQNEFLEAYQGFDEEVLALISCIKKPVKWALFRLEHLDIFAYRKVFLMGDAAHAMLPHLGAAATIGIEDAYLLASVLAHHLAPPSVDSRYIELMTNIYNIIRVPRAIRMSELTDETGYLLSLTAPGFNLEQYKLGDSIPLHVLEQVFHRVERITHWTTSDHEEGRKKAEELLEREFANFSHIKELWRYRSFC